MGSKGQGTHILWSKVTQISKLKLKKKEKAEQIEIKFHMKPLWQRETKVCSNGLGYITKMAAKTIYRKNP